MTDHPTEPWKTDLHDCLVALVKIALAEEAPEAALWRANLTEAQARLPSADPHMARTRLDSLWNLAVREAERDPAVRRNETVNPTLPALCPLNASNLFSASFESEPLLGQLRGTASFG